MIRHSHNFIDLTGKRYGHLKVLNFAGSGVTGQIRRRSYWLCLCVCGNTKEISREMLHRHGATSCGCLEKPSDGSYRGEVTRQEFLRNYKKSAKRRGIEWHLTDAEFESLTTAHCHYCGTEPCTITKTKIGGTYVFNGVDRRDNTQSYTYANCVTCCNICNRGKLAMAYEPWLGYLRRLRDCVSPALLEAELTAADLK